MKKNIIILIIMICLPALSIFSQEIITDRPDVTESSSTIPKNSFQIESGMIWQKTPGILEDEINIIAPSTLFRYGLLNFLEIRIFSHYQNNIRLNNNNFPTINSGFNDLEIGAKIQLFKKEDSKTEIAFITHLLLPTGSVGFSNGEIASINIIAVSHELTKNLEVGYNLGYIYNWTGESSLTYSLALGYSVNEKFGFYIEPYGDITEFSEYITNINGGIVYKVRDNFQVDFSFGTGINHSMNFYGLGFGWNISRKND